MAVLTFDERPVKAPVVHDVWASETKLLNVKISFPHIVRSKTIRYPRTEQKT